MPSNRPGCFGSPLCHLPATDPCRSCPVRRECGLGAIKRAADLRQRHGISDILHSNERLRTRKVAARNPT